MLDDLRVSYISECEDFPPYQLDLYLPEWHLCVEVDGPTHGRYSAKDRERDDVLKERYGIITLRIPTDSVTGASEPILSFIERHAETAATRKEHGRYGLD